MCASLLLCPPAPPSRACARSDSRVRLAALGRTPLLPHRASLRERRIRRATPAGFAGPVWHSPAPTPGESRHRPPHMYTEFRPTLAPHRFDAALSASRGASRFFWESALSGCCALVTPDSPHRDRSVRPSARCLPLSRSLRSRLLQQAADAHRQPSICRRIAILPRPSRAPPPAGRPSAGQPGVG